MSNKTIWVYSSKLEKQTNKYFFPSIFFFMILNIFYVESIDFILDAYKYMYIYYLKY